MYNFRKMAASACIAVAIALPSASAAQIFKGETAGVGDPVHTMFVAFSN